MLQIDTKKSVPQESKPKARKIFVGGLAPETTEGAYIQTYIHTLIIIYSFAAFHDLQIY